MPAIRAVASVRVCVLQLLRGLRRVVCSSRQVTKEALDSLKKTRCGLKGGFTTGVGRGSKPSINIELRRSMDLYANLVHSFNLPGVASRHEGVDIAIIRENTEGEYSGMEHEVRGGGASGLWPAVVRWSRIPSLSVQVAPGITESLKVMTRDATRRIAQYGERPRPRSELCTLDMLVDHAGSAPRSRHVHVCRVSMRSV